MPIEISPKRPKKTRISKLETYGNWLVLTRDGHHRRGMGVSALEGRKFKMAGSRPRDTQVVVISGELFLDLFRHYFLVPFGLKVYFRGFLAFIFAFLALKLRKNC